MPLDDTTTIDRIQTPPGGRTVLLIVDSPGITDPETRLRNFQAKLNTYRDFIASPEFDAKYGERSKEKVTIVFLSQSDTTPEMRAIRTVEIPGWSTHVNFAIIGVVHDASDSSSQE